MDVEKATAAVKAHCEKCGYDVSKVDTMYRQMLSGRLYYAFFPREGKNGLMDDMETQAVPLFAVDSAYCVEEFKAAATFFGAVK